MLKQGVLLGFAVIVGMLLGLGVACDRGEFSPPAPVNASPAEVEQRLADLASPDRATRLAGARFFLAWVGSDQRVRPALQAAVAKEKDQEVQVVLRGALANRAR